MMSVLSTVMENNHHGFESHILCVSRFYLALRAPARGALGSGAGDDNYNFSPGRRLRRLGPAEPSNSIFIFKNSSLSTISSILGKVILY